MMRIVERLPHTGTMSYQVIRGAGVVAGLFALVLCILLIANNLRVKSLDPIHLQGLEQLITRLEKNPADQALREEIRALDLLARKAFFTSQAFNRNGIRMMLGALLIMALSFKYLSKTHQAVPYPEGRDTSNAMIEDAHWTRWAIGGFGLFLVTFALVLGLTSQNELDKRLAAIQAPKEPDVESPAAGVVDQQTAKTEALFPSREELLANWTGFRGLDGLGFAAPDIKAPTEWDGVTGKGILWKVKVPKSGFGSPVVWEDKVFLTGGDDQFRDAWCYNAADGTLLWHQTVPSFPGSPETAPKTARDTGHAAASPATNGSLFFAIFSTGDLVAYNFDGELVWGKNMGVPDNTYGHSSSLIIFEDLLIVQMDHKGESGLYALETGSGRVRWETPRNEGITWASPALVHNDKQTLVILCNEPMVTAYDVRTGNEAWRKECLGGEVAPSPSYADGLLVVASDYVRIAGLDIHTREMVWENDSDMPGVSSPLIANGLVFYGLNYGGIFCLDAKTGEELWYEETDNGFYASPILAGDHIYFMDREGGMHIFAAAAEYKPVGRPLLGEKAVCTPVFSKSRIIMRGVEHLFCIGT